MVAFLVTFKVPKESEAAFIEDSERIVSLLSRQPGFIRAQGCQASGTPCNPKG